MGAVSASGTGMCCFSNSENIQDQKKLQEAISGLPMTQSAKFQNLKKPKPAFTPECNLELTDQNIREGQVSREARRHKKNTGNAHKTSHGLNQRNNEKVIRFLTQMKKHEFTNETITPMSKVETAHCTPIELVEGGDTGKTGQSNMSPAGSKDQRKRREINFDDFIDSTPEKDEPTIEILQKKLVVKPKKKSVKTVRRVIHDINTTNEFSNPKLNESYMRRQPYHKKRQITQS